MVNHTVAFFMVHPNRSKLAFEQLVEDWKGILVSDNYGVYVKWVNSRQNCLAHYIRKAKALVERKDKSISRFGKSVRKQLQQLCHWAKAPPSEKQWTEFYSEFLLNLLLFESADDDAGQLARSLLRQMDTCRIKALPVFPILVDAIGSYFKEQQPDLGWLTT